MMQQMKKMTALMMVFTLLFTVFAAFTAETADARRGGFKSPKKSYTQTPNRAQDNVNRSDSATSKPAAGTTAGTANTNRGFFSGGSLMKGMMIGGLAGLMFGSMFAGMGFMGDFLGLLINVLAIYLLFVAARAVFRYFRDKKQNPADPRRPY